MLYFSLPLIAQIIPVIEDSSTSSLAPFPSPIPVLFNGNDQWVPLGCYNELADFNTARALGATGSYIVPAFPSPDSLTPTLCLQGCSATSAPNGEAFIYAAVENSRYVFCHPDYSLGYLELLTNNMQSPRECYCGITLSDLSKPQDPALCSSACTGDATISCGGSGFLVLYELRSAITSSSTSSLTATNTTSQSSISTPTTVLTTVSSTSSEIPPIISQVASTTSETPLIILQSTALAPLTPSTILQITSSTPAPTSNLLNPHKISKTGLYIGIAFGILALIFLAILLFFLHRRATYPPTHQPTSSPSNITTPSFQGGFTLTKPRRRHPSLAIPIDDSRRNGIISGEIENSEEGSRPSVTTTANVQGRKYRDTFDAWKKGYISPLGDENVVAPWMVVKTPDMVESRAMPVGEENVGGDEGGARA